jgi:hypothetical protein
MRALWVLLIALLAVPAAAQLRTIPKDTHLAQIRHVQANVVELNKARVQLAPGARIHDASNRTIIPVSIPPGALVKYRLDANHQVSEVWILTRQEAEAKQ